MKVLVIWHLTGKDIRPYLEAEGRRVTELAPTASSGMSSSRRTAAARSCS